MRNSSYNRIADTNVSQPRSGYSSFSGFSAGIWLLAVKIIISLKRCNGASVFNQETGAIVRPLDEYDARAPGDTSRILVSAEDVAIGKCMTASGHKSTVTQSARPPGSGVGSREYGLWNVEAAWKYSYFPPGLNSADGNKKIADGDAWSQVRGRSVTETYHLKLNYCFPTYANPTRMTLSCLG